MNATTEPATTSDTTPTASFGSAAAIANVLVVGAGQMGSGIAQVFAQAGRRVWLSDVGADALERAQKGIESSAGKLHAKGRIDDDALAHVRKNIAYIDGHAGLSDTTDIHLAIEAITEDPTIKLGLLRDLDQQLPASAIIASNTSSISITRLAGATSPARAPRVIGMHFMNPVPVLELVEIIAGLDTDPAVTELISSLARELGKVPVIASDDPGFITNRILMPMINEAFVCLHEGVGTAEAIDDAMRLGMRHPLGPLALADLIGLDTCLSIMEVLHRDIGDSKYRPSPLLRRYVDAGRFGRKTGAGVYRYDAK
ncbi:MAG: 3-hydroxybutyryl-CoA dehydrogenase [Thermoleophilia bacterium]|nr:3-hydroxybutyryl-CoA dehydrogenase [Thermoleophilia bacterium]